MNKTDVVDPVRGQPGPPSGMKLLGVLMADDPLLSALWARPQSQEAVSLKVMSDFESSPHPATDPGRQCKCKGPEVALGFRNIKKREKHTLATVAQASKVIVRLMR